MIQAILLSIFNAYIIYRILKRKGPEYAFYFLFIWDMIYTTMDFKGTGIGMKAIIVIVIALIIENLVKVYLNNLTFKKIKKAWLFIIISMFLEIISQIITIIILNPLISLL